MSVSIEQVVAIAITDRDALDELSGALVNDLVLANPHLRRIAEFADEFSGRYGKLPRTGDWQVWLESLEEGMIRDGAREALGRLRELDLSGFEPAHLVESVLPILRQAAARTARSRLEAMVEPDPEAFVALAEQLDAISMNGGRPETVFPTLRVLQDDETLAREPEELIGRLVWRGGWTVLAGDAFTGKSTLVGQGAAAFTRGRSFLDRRAAGTGTVVYVNVLDEPLVLTVRRLTAFGALPGAVRIYDYRRRTGDLVGALRKAIEEFTPDVVVIDSLVAWARATAREMPSSGSAAEWAEVTRPLAELAHEYDIGLLVLHHMNRAGTYRDSTEIAAACDVLIEMTAPTKADPSLRHFVSVSRLTGRSVWRARFVDEAYHFTSEVNETPADRGDAVDRLIPKVREALEKEPGRAVDSKNALVARVGSGRNRVLEAVERMVAAGTVRVEPAGRAERVVLVEASGEDEAPENEVVDELSEGEEQ